MDFYGLLALRMGWISIDIYVFFFYDMYGLLALMCLVNYLLILRFYY